jgi:hypothetical protein
MPIDNYATPPNAPQLVRGHHREARVSIISTINGSHLIVPVSTAASFIAQGQAELLTEPDADIRAALDAAIDRYREIPAVKRSNNP